MKARIPHPSVWAILFVPYGVFSGFVMVALTFLATERGLSIGDGALLDGALLATHWLRWAWAPLVDATLTPRRWYVLSAAASAAGIFALCAIPLGPGTVRPLVALIAVTSMLNTVVSMTVEAMIASSARAESIPSLSGWLQAGNVGSRGIGGALGLVLLTTFHQRWIAGGILGGLLMACCLALRFVPEVEHAGVEGVRARARDVLRSVRAMLRTKVGVLAALLCALPIGGGGAVIVLTQARVAAYWGAGRHEVELLQGLLDALLTVGGCFAGAWLCRVVHARTAYLAVGLLLTTTATVMAVAPATVRVYVAGNVVYAFLAGGTYSTFSAFALEAIGRRAGATKYSVLASLANFPFWWLGLVLGFAAERYGPRRMLLIEAGAGAIGAALFLASAAIVRRSRLADV